jgi:uncharacterized protein (DUF433 family)
LKLQSRIVIQSGIILGKPAIRGTRLTVELLLRKMSEGATAADLLQMYPQLEVADIEASLRYAAAKATE